MWENTIDHANLENRRETWMKSLLKLKNWQKLVLSGFFRKDNMPGDILILVYETLFFLNVG